MLTVKALSKEVIKLGGSVVDYFIDNTGLTSEKIKELYNSNEANEFRDVVYFIYRRKQLPSESYELVCDFIQDSIREAHATIPHNDIPMGVDDEVFNIVYEDCLNKLIAWATKEVRACDGNKLLKPKLIKTNEDMNKNLEEDEINIEEFDAKVIGDMAISKSDDIVSYFIKKTGLTHEVIQDSFYNTEERLEYKRIYNIRNFDDSDGEMREVIQRWIRGIMNNISFNKDTVPEEAKTELVDYLRTYATAKLTAWIENEFSQCIEPEPQIDENVNNIDISVIDTAGNAEEENLDEEDETEVKEEGLLNKITGVIANKFVEKSVAPIKKPPFVFETVNEKKVFVNPNNIVLAEEETEELTRVYLDNGKNFVINCTFYTFMEDYSDFTAKNKR